MRLADILRKTLLNAVASELFSERDTKLGARIAQPKGKQDSHSGKQVRADEKTPNGSNGNGAPALQTHGPSNGSSTQSTAATTTEDCADATESAVPAPTFCQVSVFVNGQQAELLQVPMMALHSHTFSFICDSQRDTFKFECLILATDEPGAPISVNVAQSVPRDSGVVVTKHLRDPERLSTSNNRFTHKLELPTLPASLKKLDFHVELPSLTALSSVHSTTTPTARFHDCTKTFSRRLALPRFDYLIYTTAASFDGEHLPLRSHYIAKALAAAGHVTAYVPSSKTEECRTVQQRLYQFDASALKSLLSDLCRQPRPGVFIVSSKPDVVALSAMQTLRLQGWRIVYEVRDDMGAMHAKGFSQYYAPELEKYIATRADLVSCVSEPIAWKLRALGVPEDNILISPNGIEDEQIPEDLEDLLLAPKEARMVYFGHMYPQRFDKELVETIARTYPNHQIDLYGIGCSKDDFCGYDNVKLLGYTTVEQFLRSARSAAVGLLPFRENPITFALSPIKYPQYLCAGLRVVSSDVHQLRGRPLCFNESKKTFLENLDAALAHDVTRDDVLAVKRQLVASNWNSARAALLERLTRLQPGVA